MCQDISTVVAYDMSASTQATPPQIVWGGSARSIRGGRGENPKQVAVPSKFYRCGKAGHYVRYCPERNTYWDPPPDGTDDTSTKFHCKKGDKVGVTMSYCSVCNHWDYHNAPDHEI